jgi:ADP-ribose diphosphatase
LKEEAGFGANELYELHTVSMAPTFFNANMTIVIAKDLYPQSLEGDEPEPLDVIHWPLAEADALLAREDFIEARCIAALLLAQKWFEEQ